MIPEASDWAVGTRRDALPQSAGRGCWLAESGRGNMTEIAMIGAGSTLLAKRLLGDMLGFGELIGATIALHDIDGERLRTTKNVADKIARQRETRPRIATDLDQIAALVDDLLAAHGDLLPAYERAASGEVAVA